MTRDVYRYTFAAGVPSEDVRSSLLLALWGAESLHGEIPVCLDAGHDFDPVGRTCTIDAGTPVGRDINRLFLGFLRREFGGDDFRVARLTSPAPRVDPPAAARRPEEAFA